MSEAREAANSLQKDWEKKSDADVQNYKERVASSVDLKRRTSILEAKQEIISSIVEKAYTAFTQKSGEEYFQVIREMLKKFVLPQDGEIFFSKKDHMRHSSARYCTSSLKSQVASPMYWSAQP